MAEQKDIKAKDLWIIKETTNEKGGGGTQLRVVQWVIDGKPGKPMLEKRDWYQTDDGIRKPGKAKGFTPTDIMIVLANMSKIAKVMQMPSNQVEAAMAGFAPEAATSDIPFGSGPNAKTNADKREPVTAGTGIPDEQF